MDVENEVVAKEKEEVSNCESDKELESEEDEVEIVSVLTTPTGKSPCAPLNGHAKSSPQTPSSVSKKRKRLSSKEREERDKHREEKRAKLEEEKQRKEEERQKRLQLKEQERQKREEEKQKKQEEIEKQKRQKEEERKKKQEEEEKRKKEKEEEKRQKEEEKKQKEEEKRQKEEERRKKLEEEEKKKKDKEEERLKKEVEKQQKLEEKEREKKKDEEKLAKQAKMFTSFFQKSPSMTKSNTPRRIPPTVSIVQNGDTNVSAEHNIPIDRNLFNPMMFEVKSNMVLAPIRRRAWTSDDSKKFDKCVLQTLDSSSEKQRTMDTSSVTSNRCSGHQIDSESIESVKDSESKGTKSNEEEMEIETEAELMDVDEKSLSPRDYLIQLKRVGGRKSCRAENPFPEPEVQIATKPIIENPKEQGLVKWRYKLLQFHTNRRPAYWGTWKRLPSTVKAKTPFKQETDIDYDFDSDDEWEEEPEDAEELGDSEKDDDHDNKDDEEEDEEDDWLVPHGYISDDEGSVDAHLDKEQLKVDEKNYFEGLKKQIKIKYPEIQTTRLSDYRIIFSPLRKKWKATCAAEASKVEAVLHSSVS